MSRPQRTVGLIGLGQMGSAMCRTLRRAGWRVVVWDLSAEAVAGAVTAGAEPAVDAADLAGRATTIITSLPDAEAVKAVTLGDRGICAVESAGLLVIDTSTTSPAEARSLALDLAAHGVDFLDAPVSGGVRGADTGQLSIMVGGAPELLERARPVLQVVGRAVIHCGPVGAGQIAKACNQLVVMATHESVAEALVIAEASGLDAWRVRDAMMAGYAASPILEIQGPRMLNRDFVPGGKARFHLKDIQTIRELANEFGLELPAFDAAAGRVERLVGQGGADLDNSALIMLIEPAPRGGPGADPERGERVPMVGHEAEVPGAMKSAETELPRPGGPYSLVRNGPAGVVYVAGQIGVDPATRGFREGGIAAQTEQALKNLAAVLATAGCALGDVLKVSVFLADIADFKAMNEAYAEFFSPPYPVRTTAQAGLGRGELIEIDAVAWRKHADHEPESQGIRDELDT